ncbi:MAG: trypsin-like peptidase domain-containing protein [Myxococcota bacterium]
MLMLVAATLAAEPIRLDPVIWSTLTEQPGPTDKAEPAEWIREALDLAEHPTAGAAHVLRAHVTSAACVRHRGERACEVGIRWSLRDGATGEERYTTLTRGLGRSADRSATTGTHAAQRDAVTDATDRLLGRDPFREQLRASARSTPPPIILRACTDAAPALPAQMKTALAAAVFVEVPEGVGSGVVVSPDGWILTAAHVVIGQEGIKVRVRDGSALPARIVALDARQDVALLRVDGSRWACLPFTPAPAEVGTELYAIGSPLGEALEFSVSKGIVSGARRVGDVRFLQTDASLNPGNSGGPLVDLSGHLLAIVSWKLAAQGIEGLGFGVPVDAVEHAFSLDFGEASVEPDEPFVLGPVERVSEPDDPRRLPAGTKEGSHVATIVTGATLSAVGSVVVLGSWGVFLRADEMGEAEWDRLLVVNTLGWVGFMGGAGLAVVPTFTSGSAGAAFTGRF